LNQPTTKTYEGSDAGLAAGDAAPGNAPRSVAAQGPATNEHSEARHGEHESANEHMNHQSFEQLVARFEDPERATWQKPDAVIRKLGTLRGKTVVDIGAGSGYFSIRLAAIGARVIAEDIDPRFLDYISKRAAAEKRGKLIGTHRGEKDDPLLEKASIDAALVVDVYHHLENRPAFLRHLADALRPRGKILIVDFKPGDLPQGPPDSLKVPSDVIAHELKESGFSGVEVDAETLPYQFVIQARRP